MRVHFLVVACSLFCLLVDPVLAETILVAKVYRDYPGYINPAVCENPNVSKPPVATAPHKIEVPLPAVPETLAGPAAAPEIPAPLSAPVAEPVTEPVTTPLPSATSPEVAPVSAPAPVESAPVTLAPAAAPVEPAASTPGPAMATAAGSVPSSNDQVITPAPKTVTVPLPVVPETAAGNPHSCKPACSGYPSGDAVHAPYLSVWAGLVATHDVDVDANGYSGEAEVDNGFAGGVAAGYDFGKVRLEVEGSYRNSNASEGDADLKVRALMANVYADFETGGTATPYLGAGVGVADVDIENEDDQVLAGQVAAGVLFAITEKVAIDLGYRFMMTDDPDIAGDELELRQHTALLGVQIKF